MKALMLAAGKGTRLRPLTDYIPKPMLPLNGRPLLEWELIHLVSNGIREVVIAVSYLADQIENYFRNGERWGVKITYSRGHAPSGKAGEILRARAALEGEQHFLVVPGDTICHLNYADLLNFHSKCNGIATVAFSTRYQLEIGMAEISPANTVIKFNEKSNLNKPVSTGIYVLGKEIFPYIERFDRNKPIIDLPADIFPVLLKEGIPIYGYVDDYAWWDVGRLYDYEELSRTKVQKFMDILPWQAERIDYRGDVPGIHS